MMTQNAATVMREVIANAAGGVSIWRGRALLAIIGIAIGTAAVIAMLQIGANARHEALRQFKKMGTDLISILPRTDRLSDARTPQGVTEGLAGKNGLLMAATPLVQGGATLRFEGEKSSLTLLAAGEALYDIARASLAVGRRHSDFDKSTLFVVLGAEAARGLAHAQPPSTLIGATILLDEHPAIVIGILEPQPNNPILSLDLNRSVIVPFEAAPRLMTNAKITSIAGRMWTDADDRTVVNRVKSFFLDARDGVQVEAHTARQVIEGLDQQMRVYAWLLLAIGAVSLVVGGVGIMNVMLMSVMERYQEIGLRRALGATRKHIKALFLIEALMFSLIGSALGVVVGTGAAWGFAAASGWSFVSSAAALPLALLMALAVVFFFGSYPAIRAANTDPIEALRSH